MPLGWMSAFDIANLRELVGAWSCLTFAVGLAGALISYFSLMVGRNISSPDSGSAKVSATVAMVMLSFALFIGFFVLPASRAYSGPVPPEVRQTWRYDKYFAALIALTFAVVFAFDTFRLSRSRRQTPRQ
jgi:hypothetical protein